MARMLNIIAMGYPRGMMVRRSDHYQKDRCVKGKPQIGIITDYTVYQNESMTQIQVWPTVMWEGAPAPTSVHPTLVDVYRPKDKRKAVYIECME